MSSTTTEAAASATTLSISSYTTGLNGVNQIQNFLFRDMLGWSFGIVGLLILTIRIADLSWARLRLMFAMALPVTAQNYWKTSQWKHMPWIKKYLTYAPIWRKRHNREMRVSAALSLGTLPTRLQSIFLSSYLISNMVYMFILDYSQDRWAMWAELRGRSGSLAAINLLPLIIFATRNNPLISLLRISFDTYNLLHRWIGRTVVFESVLHTVAWLVVQLKDGGWASVGFKTVHDRFIASGFVGVGALLLLVVISLSPLRHAFYETFLATHIVLALVVFVCIWVHCVTSTVAGGLPQLSYMIAVFVIWVFERLTRVGLGIYASFSRYGWPDAVVEPLPGDTCRVTIHLPRYLDVQPGTHAYLRFLRINPWECHPFSIAWVEHKPRNTDGGETGDILPFTERSNKGQHADAAATEAENCRDTSLLRTSVSFVISAQTGFTRKLFNRASERDRKYTTFKAMFEGPYAGHHSLDSYGHVVLVAGASGITHQISYLQHLVKGYAAKTVATRRVTLVWIVREYSALEWIQPWMDKILQLPNRHEILRVQLFVTRPGHAIRPNQVTSRTIQILPGRPNVPVLLRKEVSEQKGAMCVTVCGPGALADDVRAAVRSELDGGTVVDFVEESFTW